MALGSTHEMDLWLSFAVDFGYLEESKGANLRERYSHVRKLLNGLDRSLTSNT